MALGRYWFLYMLCFLSIMCCYADEEGMRQNVERVLQSSKEPYVLRININDASEGISTATLVYIRSAIDYCHEKKPALVILELNTPGGEVYASEQIGNALRALDTKEGIPVIAYINNWAISAGAMLAYSCRFIVASPDASMGAACPVFFTKDEMKEAPEKINSALRSDFANRAAFFDRNPDIAVAMVDADTLLVKRDGSIIALVAEKDLRSTDIILSPRAKLLTLTGSQMKSYGVADYCVDKSHAGIPDEILPHKAPASETVFGSFPGFESFQSIPIETFQIPPKARFFAMLAAPTVCSVLFFIVCICVYMEMSSPGILFPAVLGGVCFVFLLLGTFAQQAIVWIELICIVSGLALIAVEIVAFPAAGFLLVIGGGLVICAVASLLLPGIREISFDGLDLNAAGKYALYRLMGLAIAFFASLLFLVPIMRIFMKQIEMKEMAPEKKENKNDPLVGRQAKVIATLRPSGKVIIDDQVYDAVSDGQFIEEGTIVKVLSQYDTKLIVALVSR